MNKSLARPRACVIDIAIEGKQAIADDLRTSGGRTSPY
jgi:hypothetical protein